MACIIYRIWPREGRFTLNVERMTMFIRLFAEGVTGQKGEMERSSLK